MIIIPLSILTTEDDGDRAFMEKLYHDHQAAMRRAARRVLNHPEDEEDVVQDTCVALCKKISLLKTMERNILRSYVVISVRNNAINLMRSRSNKPELLWGETEYLDSVLYSQQKLEDDLFAHIEQGTLTEAIMRLPLRERDLLERKYILQDSDQKIAHAFGIKPASIRVLLMRTRQKLSNLIKEIENEEREE